MRLRVSWVSSTQAQVDVATFPELTVVEALAELATTSAEDQGFTFMCSKGRSESFLSFEALAASVAKRAGALIATGLGRGDHVVLVIPKREEFVLTFLGALWAGIVPVPVAPPIGIDQLTAYIERSHHIVHASKARTLVTTAQLKAVSGSLLGNSLRKLVTVEELARDPSPQLGLIPPSPDATAFLQFTSGSTSRPKGVLLTHRNLTVNCHSLAKSGMGLTADDVLCSWLPFFHDFGLIGMVLAPIFTGSSVVYVPPLLFLKRPVEWLRAITRHKGTVSFAPNFGYGLCAKRVTDLDGLDLSTWRYAGCGAEPVRMSTLRSFSEKFEPVGFRPSALTAGYGMAESTLAVAFDKSENGPRHDSLDPAQLYTNGRAEPVVDANAVDVVCCGSPFEGHEAKAVDESDRTCPDRVIGEIVLKGPSVMLGYYDNPVATASAIQDGWLHTGDLGYMVDGRIYITGRKKEIIIVAGANYYPTDIEHAVSKLAQVRTGNVVAFGISLRDQDEALVVCAETSVPREEYPALVAQIRSRVAQAIGLEVYDVVLIEAGSLRKTSSGKLQRCDMKAMYLGNKLPRRPQRDSKVTTFKHFSQSRLRILWSRVSAAVRSS